MKLTDRPKVMPFHWRAWTTEQKSLWCQSAIRASGIPIRATTLIQALDQLVAVRGVSKIDKTPLHTHAAIVLVAGRGKLR